MDTSEKAFDFASASSNLLTTLSTGIIAFMIAFLDKEALMKPINTIERSILVGSWIILLISAISGIWTLLGITTVLEPKTRPNPFSPTIRSRKVKVPFIIQTIAFGLGVIVTVIYGLIKIF